MTVIEELLETFKAQQQTIDTLTMKLDQANARIAELEEQLHKDSHNSSKPPSSDGFDKPAPKSQRKKSGKKTGGQTGHKGHHMTLSKPDRIEAVYPQHCADCPHRTHCGKLKVHDTCYAVDIEITNMRSWRAIARACKRSQCVPPESAVPSHTETA